MRKTSLCVIIIFLTTLMAPVGGVSSAWAGFKVCNERNRTVSVAWGWISRNGKPRSKGWVKIGSHGQCKTLFNEITNRYVYIYAAKEGKTRIQGDIYKGDGYRFCVDPYKNFFYEGKKCSGKNSVSKNFLEVNTKMHSDFTFSLE